MWVAEAKSPKKAKSDARADERKPNETAAEFDRLGKAAYKQKKWDDAIAGFEGAYAADPLPRFLFNLARCHEKKGDLGHAARYFERYLKAAPTAEDRKRVKVLAEMLKLKLAKTHRKVTVTSEPDGAYVRVRLEGDQGTVEGATPFSEWLPFGAHVLEVRKKGFDDVEEKLLVQPKMVTEIAVRLGGHVVAAPPPESPPPVETAVLAGAVEGTKALPAAEEPVEPPPGELAEPAEPEAAAAAAPPAPAEVSETTEVGWLPMATVGLGVVLLGSGGVFGLLADGEMEERDSLAAEARTMTHDIRYSAYSEHHEAARSRALVANVLLGAGALAVASGVVLLLAGGDEEEPAVAVWPAGAPGGIGLAGAWSVGP